MNPRTYIDHTSAIPADTAINQAKAYFNAAGTEFAALLNDNKVVGLITKETVLASQTNKSLARDYISAHGLIISTEDSIEYLIRRALKRPEKHLLDDIILVDKHANFLGLITQRSFIKIQSAYYGQQIELIHSTLRAKNIKIDNLEIDLKLAERQLSENKEMVRRMKVMRSDFMSKFSQEAQTPIASIQTMLTLLSKSVRHTEQLQLIDSAIASTHTLFRLISSTLDYTKIDTNSLKLIPTKFSPIEVIQTCIDAYKEAAIEKDLIIQFDHRAIAPTIIGYAQQFTQIIDTLIDRSIDQTSAGGIHIKVSQHEIRDKIILHLEIRDSGMGWSLAETQGLFEPQDTTPHETHISDIGTLVSERIANKMGGQLKYTCVANSGSLITLDLPFKIVSKQTNTEKAKAKKNSATPPEEEQPKTTQLQVLIVDQNEIHSLTTKRFLQKLDCNTHTALEGMDALKILKTQQIDCIFIDCQLTKLSCIETTELIRSGECGKRNKNIFILAMSEFMSEHARRVCMSSGMNYFAAKPLHLKTIEAALTACKEHKAKLDALQKKSARGSATD